jgi:adenylate cyclase class IV
MVGRTRVHLDQVDGLGHFLELEVVLAEGEQPTAGMAVANELLGKLAIPQSQLIDKAYVDMLPLNMSDPSATSTLSMEKTQCR